MGYTIYLYENISSQNCAPNSIKPFKGVNNIPCALQCECPTMSSMAAFYDERKLIFFSGRLALFYTLYLAYAAISSTVSITFPHLMYNISLDCYFNSLWSSCTIWQHWSLSTLAQVMTCCLMAPNHYLNQCWLLISEVMWYQHGSNFTVNTQYTILYELKKYIFEIIATSPRWGWVNLHAYECGLIWCTMQTYRWCQFLSRYPLIQQAGNPSMFHV